MNPFLQPCGLFLLAGLIAGCGREGAGCLTALGDPDSLTVMFGEEVLGIRVEDRIAVEWWPSSEPAHITWHAGAGVLPGLGAEVRDGELVLEDRNGCAWVRPLDAVPLARIRGGEARTLQLNGQGRFDMKDTLHGGDLRLEGDEMSAPTVILFSGDTLQARWPNGIGHLHIGGRAKRFRAFRSGFGDLDASAFVADQMLIHHGGLGDVRLAAPGYLYLEVAGPGSTHIQGTPDQMDLHRLEGGTGEVVIWP